MAGVEMAKRHPSLWAALPHQFYYTAIFFSSEFPGAVQVYYGFSDIDLCSQAAQQFEDLVFHVSRPLLHPFIAIISNYWNPVYRTPVPIIPLFQLPVYRGGGQKLSLSPWSVYFVSVCIPWYLGVFRAEGGKGDKVDHNSR